MMQILFVLATSVFLPRSTMFLYFNQDVGISGAGV